MWGKGTMGSVLIIILSNILMLVVMNSIDVHPSQGQFLKRFEQLAMKLMAGILCVSPGGILVSVPYAVSRLPKKPER
jgi:hypothetical protein